MILVDPLNLIPSPKEEASAKSEVAKSWSIDNEGKCPVCSRDMAVLIAYDKPANTCLPCKVVLPIKNEA